MYVCMFCTNIYLLQFQSVLGWLVIVAYIQTINAQFIQNRTHATETNWSGKVQLLKSHVIPHVCTTLCQLIMISAATGHLCVCGIAQHSNKMKCVNRTREKFYAWSTLAEIVFNWPLKIVYFFFFFVRTDKKCIVVDLYISFTSACTIIFSLTVSHAAPVPLCKTWMNRDKLV